MENKDVRYRFGNESSYHHALAEVYSENDAVERIQHILKLLRKKYGDDTVRTWHQNEGRIAVELRV